MKLNAERTAQYESAKTSYEIAARTLKGTITSSTRRKMASIMLTTLKEMYEAVQGEVLEERNGELTPRDLGRIGTAGEPNAQG